MSVVGSEVQRLRRERGLSGAAVAAVVGFSPSKLSKLETGRAAMSEPTLRRLLQALSVPAEEGEALVSRLRSDQRAKSSEASTGRYISVRELAELEASATSLLVYAPQVVPGLLQSSGYAQNVVKTMISVLPRSFPADHSEVATREAIASSIGWRMIRQRTLDEASDRDLRFVLDQRCLERPSFCHEADWREQYCRLKQLDGRSEISIRWTREPSVPWCPEISVFDGTSVVIEDATGLVDMTSSPLRDRFIHLANLYAEQAERLGAFKQERS